MQAETTQVRVHDSIPDTLQEILTLVIMETGVSNFQDQVMRLQDAVATRMNALNLESMGNYLCALRDRGNSREEMEALVAELTVGETYLFRHPEQFEIICRKVIPDLIATRNQQRSLRIWSAGCSNGAEAYTLSIFLDDRFARELRQWRVEILGTDINRKFLLDAKRACYRHWTLRQTPERILSKYFDRHDDSWRLRDKYRAGVKLEYHNLVRDPVPSIPHGLYGMDLILCRNVLMYFEGAVAQQVVARMAQALAPGGWLLLGPTDWCTAPPGLEWIRNEGATCQLFRRSDSPANGEAGTRTAAVPRSQPGDNARRTEPESQPVVIPEEIVSYKDLPAAVTARPDTSAADPSAANVTMEPAGEISQPDCENWMQLLNRGRWNEVAECCQEQIRRNPLAMEAYLYRGLALQQMGDADAARNCYEKTIYLDPAAAMAHFQLGLLQREESAEPARKSFLRAFRLLADLPDDAPVACTGELSVQRFREVLVSQIALLQFHD